MCLVKKFGLDLRRSFVTGYCVACLRKQGTPLVDVCFFSGEGKPVLLGGYAVTAFDALRLGNELILNANRARESTPEQKKSIAQVYLADAYRLLKDCDGATAERLKKSMDIKEVEQIEPDLGYVG